MAFGDNNKAKALARRRLLAGDIPFQAASVEPTPMPGARKAHDVRASSPEEIATAWSVSQPQNVRQEPSAPTSDWDEALELSPWTASGTDGGSARDASLAMNVKCKSSALESKLDDRQTSTSDIGWNTPKLDD